MTAYRFYGQAELDRHLFENYFPDKFNGYFVECGAFDGLSSSACKFFEEFRGWHGMNIEPVPYLYALCAKNRPDCLNLQCALAGSDGQREFTHVLTGSGSWHFGNGSLQHTESHYQSLSNDGYQFTRFPVQCRSFASLVKEYELPPIDLFVLDIEGTELEALSGILAQTNLPQVFCIEHGHLGTGPLQSALAGRYELCGSHHVDSIFRRVP